MGFLQPRAQTFSHYFLVNAVVVPVCNTGIQIKLKFPQSVCTEHSE